MIELNLHHLKTADYLSKNPIIDTKRYIRHKDACRQFLNEWVLDTYQLGSTTDLTKHTHLIDINDGSNEPMCKILSIEIYYYYENILRKRLASNSYLPVTSGISHRIPSVFYSMIESYMIKLLESNKDNIKIALENKANNINIDKYQLPNKSNKSYVKNIELYSKISKSYTNKAKLNVILANMSYLVSNYFQFFTGAVYDPRLNDADKVYSKPYSFIQIINDCFDKMFYKYIITKWYSDVNINENNYTTFTKFTYEMCDSFFLELIQVCKYELESAWVDYFYMASNNEFLEKQYDELFALQDKHEKEYNERKQNEPDLLLQNQQLESQLKIEKDSKASLEKSLLENIANLNKINKENQNTINELTTQYDDMITYYKSIIASMNSANTEEPTIINIDKYKKYIFVAADKIKNEAIYNILLTEFPNSKVIYSDFNLVSDSDLVVFLTAILDHSTYFMIKNQCISKNIPYIHCHKRNINDIKAEISKFS